MKVIIHDRIVQLTPEMMAIEFANSSADDQVRFLNAFSYEVEGWGKPWDFQARAIASTGYITQGAKHTIAVLAEHIND